MYVAAIATKHAHVPPNELLKLDVDKLDDDLITDCYDRVVEQYNQLAKKLAKDGELDFDQLAKGPAMLRALSTQLKRRLTPERRSRNIVATEKIAFSLVKSGFGAAGLTLGSAHWLLGGVQSNLGVVQSMLGFAQSRLGLALLRLGFAQLRLRATRPPLSVAGVALRVARPGLGMDGHFWLVDKFPSPSYQFGEEVVDLHCVSPKIFFSSAWKRGSLRTLS